MAPKEIKPSFSFKYLILTFISAIIIAIVSLVITKLYEKRPIKEIIVYDTNPISLINDPKLPKDQIIANYYLKDDPNKKIESFFLIVSIIKNIGNVGVEDLQISFNIKDNEAKLVSNPKINTDPKEIINAISIKKIEELSTDKKHLWNISLLNPGESLLFEYSIYSEAKMPGVELDVVPRKKDWMISRKSFLSNKEKIIFSGAIVAMLGPIFLIFFIFMIFTPVYIYQWNKRPDFRQEYGNFSTFYWNHWPTSLFKRTPPCSSAGAPPPDPEG